MSRHNKGRELISYFQKAYSNKYGRPPELNVFWGVFDATILVEELGKNEAFQLIDFYFETKSSDNHSFKTLLFNYEKYWNQYKVVMKDREKRRRLREETKKRVNG